MRTSGSVFLGLLLLTAAVSPVAYGAESGKGAPVNSVLSRLKAAAAAKEAAAKPAPKPAPKPPPPAPKAAPVNSILSRLKAAAAAKSAGAAEKAEPAAKDGSDATDAPAAKAAAAPKVEPAAKDAPAGNAAAAKTEPGAKDASAPKEAAAAKDAPAPVAKDSAAASKEAVPATKDAAAAKAAPGSAATVSVEAPSKEDQAKVAEKAKAAPQTSDEEFSVRVKTMEEQVNDLKEKIFRTKARLLLLQESVLGGSISQGAKSVLVHRNEMGSSFVLESVAYALDGAPVYTKVDVDGDLDKKEEFEIFNGRIVPGQHQIAVKLQFRGHGFGVFSYLEGYKFKVQSSYTFDAEPGKVTTIKIVAHEKGGLATDLKDRPAVRYDVERADDTAPRKQGLQAQSSRMPTPATAAAH